MPGELPQSSSRAAVLRGRWVTLGITSVGVLALAGLSFLKLTAGPSLRLATCFQDLGGLRAGARVRVAGVDVGTVRRVRAQPTDKACPGRVEMELQTPYELKIPVDSIASTATAGILGETYLDIDVSKACGPPIASGGRLPSKESTNFTAATVDRALEAVKLLKQLSEEEKKSCTQTRETQSGARPSPKPSRSSVPK